MEIKKGFVNRDGIAYPKVREIAFTKDNYFGNLGTLVNETKKEPDLFFGTDSMDFDDRGVYIYKSDYDERKALRIYKSFTEYKFNGDKDDELVSRLQKLQRRIKLTEFPAGIVTLDGNIIGQEIPYYEEYNPFIEVKDNIRLVEILNIYKKCLLIIKELNDKGIQYLDIHAKNFLINSDLDVKLIDFENDLVKFNDKESTIITLDRFYEMINYINKGIKELEPIKKEQSFDEALLSIDRLQKKYIKRSSR